MISWEDLKIVWSYWPIFCLKEICLKKFMVPHYPLFYDEKSFRALYYSLDKQKFDCVKNSNLLDGNVWIANCLLTLATIVRICLPKYKISALKSIFILLWKWHKWKMSTWQKLRIKQDFLSYNRHNALLNWRGLFYNDIGSGLAGHFFLLMFFRASSRRT